MSRLIDRGQVHGSQPRRGAGRRFTPLSAALVHRSQQFQTSQVSPSAGERALFREGPTRRQTLSVSATPQVSGAASQVMAEQDQDAVVSDMTTRQGSVSGRRLRCRLSGLSRTLSPSQRLRRLSTHRSVPVVGRQKYVSASIVPAAHCRLYIPVFSAIHVSLALVGVSTVCRSLILRLTPGERVSHALRLSIGQPMAGLSLGILVPATISLQPECLLVAAYAPFSRSRCC